MKYDYQEELSVILQSWLLETEFWTSQQKTNMTTLDAGKNGLDVEKKLSKSRIRTSNPHETQLLLHGALDHSAIQLLTRDRLKILT